MSCLKCSICGKFAKIVDSYIPYGHSEDIEPPDEVLMCQDCVDKEIEHIKKNGYLHAHWIPADFEQTIAKEWKEKASK